MNIYIIECGIGYGTDYRVAVAETIEEAKEYVKDAIRKEYAKRDEEEQKIPIEGNITAKVKEDWRKHNQEMLALELAAVARSGGFETPLPLKEGYVEDLHHEFIE
jgi:hypothetical protein